MSVISIVVPAYNVDRFICKCLDSILAQNYKKYEIIVVDDGSLDDCGLIIDGYAKKDYRIIVIHKKNAGLSDARNKGIDLSFAFDNIKWISFIDSDDWVHPYYLSALYEAMKKTGCQTSIGAYKLVTEEIEACNTVLSDAELVTTEYFFCKHNTNAIIACGKLYEKDLFRDIRYPLGKLHEDEFTTYKILFKNKYIAYQSFPLYFYYYNENSITKSEWSPRRLDSIEALEKTRSFFTKSRYQDALEFCIRHLVLDLVKHYHDIQNCKREDYLQNYIPYVKKKLRKNLIGLQAHKILPVKKYAYCYEIAFPKEMQIYWIFQSLKTKIMRKLCQK